MKLVQRFNVYVTTLLVMAIVATMLAGCSSSNTTTRSDPHPQQQVREAIPPAPYATAQTNFIDEMATIFTQQLFQRINIDKATHRLVVALEAPTGNDAMEVGAFADRLTASPAFTDNFLLVRLESGQPVASLSQPLSNDGAERLPDGKSPDTQRRYPPDSVYYAQLGYSDTQAGGGGKRFIMTWRVQHPRKRQLIMSQKYTRSLVWKNGNWSLVEESN